MAARLALRFAARFTAAAVLAWSGALGAQPAEAAGPLLTSDRDVTVWVDDVDAAAPAVARRARELGGELVEQEARRVIVRVPAGKVADFVADLAATGRVVVRRGASRDTSFERADLEARLRQARGQRDRLAGLLARAANVEDSLRVERAIAPVDTEIARLTTQIAAMDREAARVTVRIDLEPREPVTPEQVPTFAPPFPWLGDLSLPALLDTTHREPPGEPSLTIRSNLDMGVQLDGLRIDRDDPQYAGLALLRARGVWDTDPFGYATGMDAGIGGGQGFVYDFAFMVGLGAALGEVSSLGLIGGIGADGWTGNRIPGAFVVPVELFATVELGKDTGRLVLFGQPRWVPTVHDRHHGAPHAPFGDEVRYGGFVTVPALAGLDNLEDGGLRLGFTYAESMGTELYVATVGLGFGLVEY